MSGVVHNPFTGTKTRTRSLESLIRLADPSFDRDRRRSPEYEFNAGKKVFRGDDRIRGPYSPRSEHED